MLSGHGNFLLTKGVIGSKTQQISVPLPYAYCCAGHRGHMSAGKAVLAALQGLSAITRLMMRGDIY